MIVDVTGSGKQQSWTEKHDSEVEGLTYKFTFTRVETKRQGSKPGWQAKQAKLSRRVLSRESSI